MHEDSCHIRLAYLHIACWEHIGQCYTNKKNPINALIVSCLPAICVAFQTHRNPAVIPSKLPQKFKFVNRPITIRNWANIFQLSGILQHTAGTRQLFITRKRRFSRGCINKYVVFNTTNKQVPLLWSRLIVIWEYSWETPKWEPGTVKR